MALQDHYGNALDTTSSTARDHYDRGVALFLGADPNATAEFQASVEADPHFSLGHAALSRSLMMDGDMKASKAAIEHAERLVDASDTRAVSHIAAIMYVMTRRPVEARKTVKAHVLDHPRDVMVAQLCTNIFGLIGFSGEVGREAELLAFTNSLIPHHDGEWWMMSMHALSLCETGQIATSQALMEKSLELNPHNAHAAHFWSHSQYEAGDIAGGRAYLADWIKGYDRRGILHGHLSWHNALWALHDGDERGMWAAVDDGIMPEVNQSLPLNIMTDAAAILYRAELAGIAVDAARWKTLSDYAARHFPNPGQSFADWHAALSHAMAGDGERLALFSETTKGFAGDLVGPLAKAWGMIARGNWRAALENLSVVMASHERVGGSRAQRDLIELAYVNVLLKLGLSQEARRTLLLRRPVFVSRTPIKGLR